MAESCECPHCGAPIYASDAVCMSCGQSLSAAQPPSVQQEPDVPKPPTASEPSIRPIAADMPITERIPAYFGTFYWDIFPWAAIAFGTLVGLSQSFVLGLLPFLAIPSLVATGLVGLALVAWLVIDVIHQDAYLIWLFVAIFCPPFGLVAYLVWGRG